LATTFSVVDAGAGAAAAFSAFGAASAFFFPEKAPDLCGNQPIILHEVISRR